MKSQQKKHNADNYNELNSNKSQIG